MASPLLPNTPWVAESEPSLAELAIRSTVNNVQQPFRFARILSEAAPPAIKALLERADLEKDDDAPVEVPQNPVQREGFAAPSLRGLFVFPRRCQADSQARLGRDGQRCDSGCGRRRSPQISRESSRAAARYAFCLCADFDANCESGGYGGQPGLRDVRRIAYRTRPILSGVSKRSTARRRVPRK